MAAHQAPTRWESNKTGGQEKRSGKESRSGGGRISSTQKKGARGTMCPNGAGEKGFNNEPREAWKLGAERGVRKGFFSKNGGGGRRGTRKRGLNAGPAKG